MSGIATAVAGTAIVGGFVNASQQKSAAKSAAGAQQRATDTSIAEQQRQFDALQKLISPYVGAGTGALSSMQALLGLAGTRRQRQAVGAIESSPLFQQMTQQGEEAILANASATGGLRGGDTQGALATFRPQMLNQQIMQQLQNLGGLATMGQNAATMQGTQGMGMASNIGNLLAANAETQGQAKIAAAQANRGLVDQLQGAAGFGLGYGAQRGWF
jgi:hypothetical protein